MLIKIPKPSRVSFLAFIALSLTLHLFVCRIPVQSMKSQEDAVQVLQVSLVSVSAPSVVGNSTVNELQNSAKTEVSKIEPSAGKAQSLKELSEQNKAKSFISSNDVGKDSVTIAKTLDNSDYIQTVAPLYPKQAIERGLQGTVIVKALINSKGLAEDVDVANSSGHGLLDESAIKAVSQWKFKNSAIAKASGEMWVQVPVKFIIR
jgi:TonB family protein